MARTTPQDQTEQHLENVPQIVDIDVSHEMETSFLEYAYSVIYSRALPDARDGLKPVQRRILYMMSDMGLSPDRGHVKSARVVGEVMGKLHPHGDAPIYDAMVRMAQSFALRLPLIDGHGNFGSLDAGPAASRYTEARLTQAALQLTEHLGEDVVGFVPNYDNQLTQPEVLPAAFPNLLVNGASGIAVGMATNMPPHNLGEVIAAAQHLIAHPEASLDDIMQRIPGPDLPSGGRIVGLSGIRDAYTFGRGSFKTRAKIDIQQLNARKTGLVVTELPYMVSPEKVIEKIKDAIQSKKLQGISDVVDLTDRHNGLRLVIGLKNGFHPQAVIAQLYKLTPMEESFGINNVALVEGQPQTLGLLPLLQVYIDHRITVVQRRTQFRLKKKQDRLHLVDGLLIAILDIDEIIRIIRASDETADARQELIAKYQFSTLQANYILELRLRQLTKFSRIELERERQELREAIQELEDILGSDTVLRQLVSDELGAIADQHASPRRTLLLESEELPAVQSATRHNTAALPLKVADDPCWVLLSTSGRIARTDARFTLDGTHPRKQHDTFRSVLPTTARGEIGVLLSTGRMLRLAVVDLPVLSEQRFDLAAGVRFADFLTLPSEERLVALVPLDCVLALGTQAGVVKRVLPDYPLNRDDWYVISLKATDELIGGSPADDSAELVFMTSRAQLLRFPAASVRAQGRNASGMAGIRLAENDTVLGFAVVSPQDPDATVVTVTGSASGSLDTFVSVKVTPFAEFPSKNRGTQGVRAHRFLQGERALTLAWAGHGPALGASATGEPRPIPQEQAKRDASGVPVTRTIDAVGPQLRGLFPPNPMS